MSVEALVSGDARSLKVRRSVLPCVPPGDLRVPAIGRDDRPVRLHELRINMVRRRRVHARNGGNRPRAIDAKDGVRVTRVYSRRRYRNESRRVLIQRGCKVRLNADVLGEVVRESQARHAKRRLSDDAVDVLLADACVGNGLCRRLREHAHKVTTRVRAPMR